MALRFPRSVWAAILLAFVVVGSLRNAVAIPAFARKYGLPCSACHEAWPKLNSFGQTFKDNGYQLMNDRDEPIWQNPSYSPIAMRVTPHWLYESAGTRRWTIVQIRPAYLSIRPSIRLVLSSRAVPF